MAKYVAGLSSIKIDEIVPNPDEEIKYLQSQIHMELLKIAANPKQGRKFPPLKQSTIDKRIQQGIGSTEPLNRTGALLKSFQVIKEGSLFKVKALGYHNLLKPYYKLVTFKSAHNMFTKILRRWFRKVL